MKCCLVSLLPSGQGYFSKSGEDGGSGPGRDGRKGNMLTDLSDSGSGVDLGWWRNGKVKVMLRF